jgi:hypothetical protein
MAKAYGRILWVFSVLLAGFANSATISQDSAVDQAVEWMAGNPVMSKVDRTVASVQTFPDDGDYSVYVVELSPKGYLILNSDDRLPLVIAFSAESPVDLSDDPQNALRAMLLNYCERMADELSTMPEQPVKAAALKTAAVTELYGPFLETSWNQCDPYNLLCPAVSGGLTGYDNRAPVGCVPAAFAQVLNFHRWPCYGTGSRSYTDSIGSTTGSHSADFSDPYDWGNMLAAHSPSDPQVNQDAVAELMYELGVIAEANYEATSTSSDTSKLGSRLGSCLFFESVDYHSSLSDLVAPMEADLRAGFPCVISIPGHAIVADGLMVDSGTTTYHINYGWGGSNNGWYTSSGIPGGSLQTGVTSLRPQLVAFPATNTVTGSMNESAELDWILPKRREFDVPQLTIKSLEQQSGSWSSDASAITGLNSGWEISSSGYSGDCWYAEESSNHTGSASLFLNEVFVPDASAQLTFRQIARLSSCSFFVEVSADDGASYDAVYSVTNTIYESSWSSRSVSLAAYAGQEIRIRFRVDSLGGYYTGTLPGIRLDNLAVTSGDWYDWEIFAVDSTLASRRFSAVTTNWDDCDDFSVFEETLSALGADWVVSTSQGVSNCFYKAAPSEWNDGCHLTSYSTITPALATRLVVRAKYSLASSGSPEYFKILVSDDRSTFTEVWSANGSTDWTDIVLDLSAYAGDAVYVRLAYEFSGSYIPGGGIWIDSVSLQEVANPELEGQPVYYTTLSNLTAGTYTLAAALTDTNAVEHAIGPSFTLTVTGVANDTDGDGLPNDWEAQHYGGPTNANPSATCSNGLNSVREAYVAGLNPTNAGSFFSVSSSEPGPSGFVVNWNAVSGRVYSVFGTTNLASASFEPLKTNILWPQSSWTDTVERAENFYRIDVQLAP